MARLKKFHFGTKSIAVAALGVAGLLSATPAQAHHVLEMHPKGALSYTQAERLFIWHCDHEHEVGSKESKRCTELKKVNKKQQIRTGSDNVPLEEDEYVISSVLDAYDLKATFKKIKNELNAPVKTKLKLLKREMLRARVKIDHFHEHKHIIFEQMYKLLEVNLEQGEIDTHIDAQRVAKWAQENSDIFEARKTILREWHDEKREELFNHAEEVPSE